MGYHCRCNNQTHVVLQSLVVFVHIAKCIVKCISGSILPGARIFAPFSDTLGLYFFREKGRNTKLVSLHYLQVQKEDLTPGSYHHIVISHPFWVLLKEKWFDDWEMLLRYICFSVCIVLSMWLQHFIACDFLCLEYFSFFNPFLLYQMSFYLDVFLTLPTALDPLGLGVLLYVSVENTPHLRIRVLTVLYCNCLLLCLYPPLEDSLWEGRIMCVLFTIDFPGHARSSCT